MWCGSAGLDAKERASPPSGPTVAHRKVAALAGTGKSITRVAKPRRREENDFRVMAFLICKLSATCHDDKRAVTAFPLTNRILLTSQSTALCKHKKAVRSTGRPFRKTAITYLVVLDAALWWWARRWCARALLRGCAFTVDSFTCVVPCTSLSKFAPDGTR